MRADSDHQFELTFCKEEIVDLGLTIVLDDLPEIIKMKQREEELKEEIDLNIEESKLDQIKLNKLSAKSSETEV